MSFKKAFQRVEVEVEGRGGNGEGVTERGGAESGGDPTEIHSEWRGEMMVSSPNDESERLEEGREGGANRRRRVVDFGGWWWEEG